MNNVHAPNSDNLGSLVEKLDKSHYDVLNTLCASAKKQALKLQTLEMHQATSQYINLCYRIIEEIQQYINLKKEHLIPYIQTLYEKDTTGHDCKNCNGTGSCSMQHELQLLELRQSHDKMSEILNRLQMAALPLYSETIYPDVYRVLRNQMALIENSLTELFLLEGSQLIPKVVEAQKNIHARY